MGCCCCGGWKAVELAQILGDLCAAKIMGCDIIDGGIICCVDWESDILSKTLGDLCAAEMMGCDIIGGVSDWSRGVTNKECNERLTFPIVETTSFFFFIVVGSRRWRRFWWILEESSFYVFEWFLNKNNSIYMLLTSKMLPYNLAMFLSCNISASVWLSRFVGNVSIPILCLRIFSLIWPNRMLDTVFSNVFVRNWRDDIVAVANLTERLMVVRVRCAHAIVVNLAAGSTRKRYVHNCVMFWLYTFICWCWLLLN